MSVSKVFSNLSKVGSGSVVLKNPISKSMSYAVDKSGCKTWSLGYNVKDKFENGELSDVARIHIYGYRFCTTNAQNSVPSSPNQPPTPPGLPSKKQMEKVFFRSVAFFWDNGGNFFAWSRDMFKTYVIEVPSVQFYWKRFHDKMEEAKKGEL